MTQNIEWEVGELLSQFAAEESTNKIVLITESSSYKKIIELFRTKISEAYDLGAKEARGHYYEKIREDVYTELLLEEIEKTDKLLASF